MDLTDNLILNPWPRRGKINALRTLAYVCIIHTSNRTHHPVCPQPGDTLVYFTLLRNIFHTE